MVDYARTTAPLQEKLGQVMRARGRRKAQLSDASLDWSDDEAAAYRETLAMVERSCKPVFPDKAATVCMFTDASLTGHALRNWSIVEKEGYPIVKVCADLDYMLVQEGGFRVYCDHSNMIKHFSPDREVKQHVKGKLQRWTLTVVGCRYVINHIAGENNLWADIVSRWGQPADGITGTTLALKRVTTRSAQTLLKLRPLQDGHFVWPTRADVVKAQAKYRRDAPVGAVMSDGSGQVVGPFQGERQFEALTCGSTLRGARPPWRSRDGGTT
ncbi:unnamed protein product [Phytophthora fragariaefolia]|uniref:Unnamed protein product n=1 Tax=Phytophthora fragariaefolia TaxID=1490495 RepID=A0A9W6XHA3_9STRA|nr:unnamed protein product [Phytophthora fragariaefolia]